MNIFRLVILLAVLTAVGCGHKSSPATPANEAAVETDSTATPAEGVAAAPATAQAVTAAPVFAVNEPMPPVDESVGAPQLMVEGQLNPLLPERDVSGNVRVYRMPDRSALLRIESLQIADKTSDLDVVLTRQAEPKTQADLAGMLPVAALKGASGNMNYMIPKDQDISELHGVALLFADKTVFATAALVR